MYIAEFNRFVCGPGGTVGNPSWNGCTVLCDLNGLKGINKASNVLLSCHYGFVGILLPTNQLLSEAGPAPLRTHPSTPQGDLELCCAAGLEGVSEVEGKLKVSIKRGGWYMPSRVASVNRMLNMARGHGLWCSWRSSPLHWPPSSCPYSRLCYINARTFLCQFIADS